MTILDALLQGILQGLTEFLPVSSDGHLSIFQHLTGRGGEGALFFTVMLHMGTLLALLAAYYKTIWGLIREFFRMVGDIFAGRFSYKAAGEERRMVIMVILSLVPLVAFFFIKDILASFSEDGDIIVEGVSFIFTGSMLFLADKCVKGRKTAGDMRPAEALCVGFFQGFAVLPGVSRSGSTISAGLLCGFSREHAVTFSFIMGIPAMIGAGIFEVRDAVQAGLSIEAAPIIVGIAASAIVGFFAIKLINWLVKTNRFGAFAYYTLALGALVLAAGIVEMFAGRSITELAAGLF